MAKKKTPSHDEIAAAAYHRYLKRGGADGGDFDDWLEAERELAGRDEGQPRAQRPKPKSQGTPRAIPRPKRTPKPKA